MNKLEVLERAFEKAYNNGWRLLQYGDKKPSAVEGVDYTSVIYSHDFAKALWGDFYPVTPTNGYDKPLDDDKVGKDAWMYHLQQMVVSSDPIKYIGGNI